VPVIRVSLKPKNPAILDEERTVACDSQHNLSTIGRSDIARKLLVKYCNDKSLSFVMDEPGFHDFTIECESFLMTATCTALYLVLRDVYEQSLTHEGVVWRARS
jgi:hypothetical protein